jgi:hypothetical protein
MFRTRCALRHSQLMRAGSYRALAMPLLSALAVNDRRPLPPNLEAIMYGQAVRVATLARCTVLIAFS